MQMNGIIPKEAQRLLDDETLKTAFDIVRLDALNALADVKADDLTAVLRLQQRVAVIDDIRSELSNAVLRTATANPSGSFA